MQIANFQAEKTKFPARLSSDTRTGKKSPCLFSHRRRHSMLHAVVLLGALGVVEAVERADEIARDAADALEAGDYDRITKLAREAVEGAK